MPKQAPCRFPSGAAFGYTIDREKALPRRPSAPGFAAHTQPEGPTQMNVLTAILEILTSIGLITQLFDLVVEILGLFGVVL